MWNFIVKYKISIGIILGVLIAIGIGVAIWFSRAPKSTTLESPTTSGSDMNTLKQLERDIVELESQISRAQELFNQGATSG